jgi:hypothetical protein
VELAGVVFLGFVGQGIEKERARRRGFWIWNLWSSDPQPRDTPM